MSHHTPNRVAVVMGGPSSEREVSLSTGRECAAALRGEGFAVTEIDAGPDLAQRLAELRPDVIFNALHGPLGEDGVVQGLFEWLGIPYTHSGVLASALAMDKTRTKEIYTQVGIRSAESRVMRTADIGPDHPMSPPYVIKPNNEGSSVGVVLVPEGANTVPALPAGMPEQVMVEAYLPGRELTVTVLGDTALTVTEIITEGWYDYAAKYEVGGSRHVVPAALPGEVFDACLRQAEAAHLALGCAGISRTDFRWEESLGLDGLKALETNTQPGMTPTSLTPEQAAVSGISFGQLCARLVAEASCKK